MQIDPFLSPCTKLNSKWIKNLNLKIDTLKLIEKKLGKSHEDMDTGEKFLNRTSKIKNLQMEPHKITKLL